VYWRFLNSDCKSVLLSSDSSLNLTALSSEHKVKFIPIFQEFLWNILPIHHICTPAHASIDKQSSENEYIPHETLYHNLDKAKLVNHENAPLGEYSVVKMKVTAVSTILRIIIW
jgi:hypothetical protein